MARASAAGLFPPLLYLRAQEVQRFHWQCSVSQAVPEDVELFRPCKVSTPGPPPDVLGGSVRLGLTSGSVACSTGAL